MSEERKEELNVFTETLKNLNADTATLAMGFALGLQASQELKTEHPQCVEK